METLHGILGPMSQPREHRLTAAALADLERHEIVDGALVRKASPSFEHSRVQWAIAHALGGFRGRSGPGRVGGWWLGAEVEIELGAHDVFQPDLAGWRIERVPDEPRGRPVRMPPDWVCEILSPSTAGRDLDHKWRKYHLARVGHYWVVEPIEQTLTVYRWQEAEYFLAMAAIPGDVVRVEPFEGIELDIGDIFGLPAGRP